VLSFFYFYGIGTKEDQLQALTWARKVEEKEAYANIVLAMLYMKGKVVPENISKAKQYLAKAKTLDPELDGFFFNVISKMLDFLD
jgi:TPR repeat protein